MDQISKAKLKVRELAANTLHFSGLSRMIHLRQQYPYRVLMFHRVLDPAGSAYPIQPGMYVSPDTFEMQMRYLKQEAKVVALDELAQDIAQGNYIEPRTVAVTFDDGWLDTYQRAWPILQYYKLPATVFLATSFIGTNETLWADKVALALICLRKQKQYMQSILARINSMKPADPAAAQRLLQILQLQDDAPLTEELDQLVESLKAISLNDRKTLVSNLTHLAKEFTDIKRPRSFLNWAEVKEMAAGGIIFGSHTHKHYPLTELSDAQVSDELQNSMQIMRAHGLIPSQVFCYPGGAYNEHSQSLLAKHQIRFALTVNKHPDLDTFPLLLGRISLHEDISNTAALFTSRVWVETVF